MRQAYKGGERVGHRYRGFKIVNMTGAQIRQTLVIIILSAAVIFIFIGIFATTQAERHVRSDLGRITAHFSSSTLLQVMGLEVPYLSTIVQAQEKEGTLSRIFFELATSIDPEDPRSFLGQELPGFALFDTEIVIAGEGVDYTSVPIESPPPPELEEELAKRPRSVSESEETPERKVTPAGGKKQVFIYHTHYTESYLPSLKGINQPNRAYDNKQNITLVGKRLGEALERRGIGAEVSSKQYKDNWNRLYRASRKTVVQAMNQNKNLEYFFDIHRDSQRRNKTTKVIDGQPYARVAFVIGTAHKNWEKNEQFAREMHKKLDELYPGLSKGVFRKSRATGNGEYNQSLSPRSILIEVGGVDNTFEEAYRTAEALAHVLAEIHFQAVPVDAPVDGDD